MKSILDYGLPGLALGILTLTLYYQERHTSRMLDLISKNAEANTRLAAMVANLASAVDDIQETMARMVPTKNRGDPR